MHPRTRARRERNGVWGAPPHGGYGVGPEELGGWVRTVDERQASTHVACGIGERDAQSIAIGLRDETRDTRGVAECIPAHDANVDTWSHGDGERAGAGLRARSIFTGAGREDDGP